MDQLHALNLGVLKEYVLRVLGDCLHTNVFGVDPTLTAPEKLKVGVGRLKSALFIWYKEDHVDFDVCELQNLTVGMLGTSAAPSLRAKAAETKGLLFFATHLAEKYAAHLSQPDSLLAAGQCLCRYFTICSLHGRRLPRGAVQDLFHIMWQRW